MSVKNFNHWVNKLNLLDFSATEKEDKIIQITDLNRFIQCYDPTLEIVDCIHHDFCIIEKNELIKEVKLMDISNLINNETISINRNKESWFVLVNDKLDTTLKSILKTIEEHNISKIYDKVFVFNFFQSSIHEIK
ncbi:hypothetical protein ACTS9K_07465 [Empedobacter sp. ULE_I145]|uniref:hypothetical protein n=1 Tax=Empedobacter sp. R132-2 TaxID=2746740 RepID=UPI0025771723|nr:hypothetical protein [Empedobacter sp. R132-2]MDM1137186.1 hypothetical protein [Empedobacter sp. R132-2]